MARQVGLSHAIGLIVQLDMEVWCCVTQPRYHRVGTAKEEIQTERLRRTFLALANRQALIAEARQDAAEIHAARRQA